MTFKKGYDVNRNVGGRKGEAFSRDNRKKNVKRMLQQPRYIPIVSDINGIITKYKLKSIGLTDLLTFDDKVFHAMHLLRKMELADERSYELELEDEAENKWRDYETTEESDQIAIK